MSGRAPRGAAIAEFAPALIILVAFVVIPLLDLTIVPIRWMLGHEIVNDYARKLALCEKFSQSISIMNADPSLKSRLEKLGGVQVEQIDLTMRVSRVLPSGGDGEILVVTRPGSIPPAWLPDGRKAPCSYGINLEVRARISPAVKLAKNPGDVSVPGLNDSILLVISSSHEWENFGRDPRNGRYFLNE